METQTYLLELPDKANSKAVVARVLILSTTDTEDYKRMSEVEVVEGIKGVSKGQTFQVMSEIHSCARDADIGVQETFYIAGSFTEGNIFVGSWTGLDFDIYGKRQDFSE